MSLFVGRGQGEGRRERRNRSHSVFGQFDITEDDETEIVSDLSDVIISDGCVDISAVDVERSSSLTMSTVRRVGEVERREMLKRKKRSQKRATVIVTSGALTFLVLAATMVTASFLMSPVIEQIFG